MTIRGDGRSIDGLSRESAMTASIEKLPEIAKNLAEFLLALQRIDLVGGLSQGHKVFIAVELQ